MLERIQYGNLKVDKELDKLLKEEILLGLNVNHQEFWNAFNKIVEKFFLKNKSLIAFREDLQKKIDKWHLERKGQKHNHKEYKSFLKEIDYLKDNTGNFEITTSGVDPEISEIAGPQLVVPLMNARFSLNAANARWGSLYDSLYGTDMISEGEGADKGGAYNPVRGHKVIEFSKNFLDKTIPLSEGSYQDIITFQVVRGSLEITLSNQEKVKLREDHKFVGYKGEPDNPSGILFKNNNLHIEIQVDREDSVGKTDLAGIKDILLESAITTIQDCEDSVAAVDAEDKVAIYRNWLGLMRGNLKETFVKEDSQLTRTLNPDRDYSDPLGKTFKLSGRSLLLVRNVGLLMTNPAVIDNEGNEIPEGILDAMFTICIAKHDIEGNNPLINSLADNVYIVKPKMHGPDEVQFTCELFEAVEQALKLKPLTVKLGIMDEERRTTVNLKECIKVAKDRVIFINTGFLDRTGDEIHTSMEAGPMIPKALMKEQPWIKAYEDWNVDKGLEAGFRGKAQIGKGMWPMPDEMLNMYLSKNAHPEAGANCAWVPSPTAATLHSLHYHQLSVPKAQQALLNRGKASIDDILTIPILEDPSSLSDREIQEEMDNNAQGILGYVVRWIDQGVGCSKVPDINNIALMEDRATCRISSQHMANWLHHGLCTEDQVIETMKKMALVVDQQNANDPVYINMAPEYNGYAFQAACNLVLKGRTQPSGYTEPILHETRLKVKA